MHKIIISKTAKKVISNSQLKTENSAVKMIPAFEQNIRPLETAKQVRKLRVAAYCRVSTGEESQQGSFTSQISYFKSVITNNPDWELVEIYVDENRSGTSRTRRQRFNQMIEDAKAGKIDHILTKSLSRFARNTVDTLNCIQELRNLQPSVGVYFQKENMYTLNRKYDFILTTMAALAQNESYELILAFNRLNSKVDDNGMDASHFRLTTAFFPRNAIPILITELIPALRSFASYFFSSICRDALSAKTSKSTCPSLVCLNSNRSPEFQKPKEPVEHQNAYVRIHD